MPKQGESGELPGVNARTCDKAEYVRRQGQTRSHTCHWPGCGKQVPPAKWGCARCWFKLPARIRGRIWKAYRPGQESDFGVSREYLDAAHEAQEWIKENYPETRQHGGH